MQIIRQHAYDPAYASLLQRAAEKEYGLLKHNLLDLIIGQLRYLEKNTGLWCFLWKDPIPIITPTTMSRPCEKAGSIAIEEDDFGKPQIVVCSTIYTSYLLNQLEVVDLIEISKRMSIESFTLHEAATII